MILIKGFDETFSQVVHSRYSYTASDIVWNAKFDVAYHTRPDGSVELDLNKVGSFQLLTNAEGWAVLARGFDDAKLVER